MREICFSALLRAPGWFFYLPSGFHVRSRLNWPELAHDEVGVWVYGITFPQTFPYFSQATQPLGKVCIFIFPTFPFFQVVFQTNICGHCPKVHKCHVILKKKAGGSIFLSTYRGPDTLFFFKPTTPIQPPLSKPFLSLNWQNKSKSQSRASRRRWGFQEIRGKSPPLSHFSTVCLVCCCH